MKERTEDKIQCRRCHAGAKFGMINSTKYYVRCSKCGVEVIIAGYQDAGPRYSESAILKELRQFLRSNKPADKATLEMLNPQVTTPVDPRNVFFSPD